MAKLAVALISGQDQSVKDAIQRPIRSPRSFAIQLIVLVILGALDRGL